jgi:putative endonuclease
MYYVYVLVSQKTSMKYIGFTSDLRKRFFAHNNFEKGYTAKYRPWKLAYYEAFVSKDDAVEREKFLKKYPNSFGHLKKRISRSLESVGKSRKTPKVRPGHHQLVGRVKAYQGYDG